MNERPVLVLTGASAGIGAALCLRAARAGYAVVAAGRNSEALALIAARVNQEGGSLVTIIGDVRDSETSTRIAEFADETYGRIDVLVANAGVAARGPLVLQSDEELEEQLQTHVLAPITLIRSCLPLLSRSKGTVFVLGSGVARMPIGGMGLYPASKAALRSASRTLRRELKFIGVGLTYVDPGAVDTDFMRRRSMPGAPKPLLTSPHTVARRILHAVASRPAELNVVSWQTALVGLAEFFPGITDFVLARAGAITGAPLIDPRLSRNDAVMRLRNDRPVPEPVAPVLRVVPPVMTKLNQITTSETVMTNSPAPSDPSPEFIPGARPSQPADAPPESTTVEDPKPPHSADDLRSHAAPQTPSPDAPVAAPAREPASANGSHPGSASASNAIPSSTELPAPKTASRARGAAARSPKAEDDDAFSTAVAPMASRMRRMNFTPEMLRSKLVAGHELSEDELALDWVGMPNKNERRLIADLCQACAEAGFLRNAGDRQWLVVENAAALLRAR